MKNYIKNTAIKRDYKNVQLLYDFEHQTPVKSGLKTGMNRLHGKFERSLLCWTQKGFE